MKESVVLGIRMDSKTRDSWHQLAGFLEVPTNKMLLFMVKAWTTEHYEQLCDTNARKKLRELIERLYIEEKLD